MPNYQQDTSSTDDMPGLVPVGQEWTQDGLDDGQGSLEMTGDEWWATLPHGLYNVYHDKYALLDTFVDPDGVLEDALRDLLDIALERHGNLDMAQEEWLECFQVMTDLVASHDEALRRLYLFRFSFERVLEWIPTLTNDELADVRTYVEWESE